MRADLALSVILCELPPAVSGMVESVEAIVTVLYWLEDVVLASNLT